MTSKTEAPILQAMDDIQEAVLRKMIENAKIERVFEMVTQIVESKSID